MYTKTIMSGPGFSEISAVVPSGGKRPDELANVVAHLKSLGFGEVLVGNKGHRMMNRYDTILEAKFDIIYTQDDDCIIHNINELVGLYKPERIIANIKQAHLNSYDIISGGKLILVGWGAVFHKSLVDFSKYLAKFPEDELFYREADRIFTWLNPHEVLVSDTKIQDFPSAYGGMSVEDEHFNTMLEAIKNLKQL